MDQPAGEDNTLNVASLALSAIALTQLYELCLKGCDFVCHAQSSSRSIQELLSRISIERHRLAIWGRRWGLSTRASADIEHDLDVGDFRHIVHSSLTSIEMAVCDLETAQSRYGLDLAAATAAAGGADTIPEGFHGDPVHQPSLVASRQTWQDRIQERQARLHGLLKLKYSFRDERKLAELQGTVAWHVDRLWDMLLANMMSGIERQLASDVLAGARTETELSLVRAATDMPLLRQHVDNDLAMRHLARAATEPLPAAPIFKKRLPYQSIRFSSPSHNSTIAPRLMASLIETVVHPHRGGRERRANPVLLEWKRGQWASEQALQMEARIDSLAQLLGRTLSGVEADNYRILECVGYFEDARPSTFGIVYKLPGHAHPTLPPLSLHDLLADRGDGADNAQPAALRRSPSLDARVQLAKRLVVSLHELHSSGWLHKQVSSENIVFFRTGSRAQATGQQPRDDEDADEVLLSRPYLVGFAVSRPEADQSGTETKGTGPGAQRPPSLRRHPRQDIEPSDRRHDIYSLGLVLLEIALWQRLEDIADDEGLQDATAFHDNVLSVAERLDYDVGRTYSGVVAALLMGVSEYRAWAPTLSIFSPPSSESASGSLDAAAEGVVAGDDAATTLGNFYYLAVAKLVSTLGLAVLG